MDNKNEALAKRAWDTYKKSCGGVSVNGDQLPSWEDLVTAKPEIAGHWRLVADTMRSELTPHDIPAGQETPPVLPVVSQTKQFRKDLDEVLQKLKVASDPGRGRTISNGARSSRERSIAVTKIQEAIMWLGMDLKAMNEQGVPGCSNPYPESKNPDSAVIEKTADGLKL